MRVHLANRKIFSDLVLLILPRKLNYTLFAKLWSMRLGAMYFAQKKTLSTVARVVNLCKTLL